jgi:ADP-ribose pyrophosphatase YjhB (NUDIX family)
MNNNTILTEKTGVGTLFVSTETKRILLNLRAPHKTHPMCWSLWGGMVEDNEQPKEALLRELREEMNFEPDIEKIYPFDVYQSRDKHFKYFSFVCVVKEEFIPELNSESAGYAWIDFGQWPKPMHLGAKISFCNKKAEDRLRLILNQHSN